MTVLHTSIYFAFTPYTPSVRHELSTWVGAPVMISVRPSIDVCSGNSARLIAFFAVPVMWVARETTTTDLDGRLRLREEVAIPFDSLPSKCKRRLSLLYFVSQADNITIVGLDMLKKAGLSRSKKAETLMKGIRTIGLAYLVRARDINFRSEYLTKSQLSTGLFKVRGDGYIVLSARGFEVYVDHIPRDTHRSD